MRSETLFVIFMAVVILLSWLLPVFMEQKPPTVVKCQGEVTIVYWGLRSYAICQNGEPHE